MEGKLNIKLHYNQEHKIRYSDWTRLWGIFLKKKKIILLLQAVPNTVSQFSESDVSEMTEHDKKNYCLQYL